MCELLVRTVDSIDPDPIRDLKVYKRGMVVTVQDDGWPWGTAETGRPDFAIIKIPSVPISIMSVFLGSLIDPFAKVPDTTNKLRQFKINLDNPSVSAQFSTGITRISPSVTLSSASVLALKVTA